MRALDGTWHTYGLSLPSLPFPILASSGSFCLSKLLICNKDRIGRERYEKFPLFFLVFFFSFLLPLARKLSSLSFRYLWVRLCRCEWACGTGLALAPLNFVKVDRWLGFPMARGLPVVGTGAGSADFSACR